MTNKVDRATCPPARTRLLLGAATAVFALVAPGCGLFGSTPPLDTAAAAPTPEIPCDPPPAQSPAKGDGYTPLDLETLKNRGYYNEVVYALKESESTPDKRGGEKFLLLLGDPVRVCPANPYGNDIPTHFDVVDVNGGKHRFGYSELSATPLGFSKRATGSALSFLKAVFRDAYKASQIGLDLGEEAAKAGFTGQVQGDHWGIYPFDIYQAARDYVSDLSDLADTMVEGNFDRGSALRNPEAAWINEADDEDILNWMVDGTKNLPNADKHQAMAECIRDRDREVSAAHSVAILYVQRDRKQWRDDIVNASEEQLAKLDEDEFKQIDMNIETISYNLKATRNTRNCKVAVKFAKP